MGHLVYSFHVIAKEIGLDSRTDLFRTPRTFWQNSGFLTLCLVLHLFLEQMYKTFWNIMNMCFISGK